MASFDDESCDIRLMVREDGRAARYTTVAFNVPPENVSPIAIETSEHSFSLSCACSKEHAFLTAFFFVVSMFFIRPEKHVEKTTSFSQIGFSSHKRQNS